MKPNKASICLLSVIAFSFGWASASALGGRPSFTISAKNITLPSNGSGSIPITLTSVNGYTGIVFISCSTATPRIGVLEPYCEPPHFGPVRSYPLNASKPTVRASIPITSLPEPPARDGGHGNRRTLTPGTYTYTIRAFDTRVPQNSAHTSVQVTVPSGIPIK